MEKAILTISGMRCASCAKVIEATLEEKSGVSAISVNYDSQKAFLEFDHQQTDIEDIKKEIEGLGYKVMK